MEVTIRLLVMYACAVQLVLSKRCDVYNADDGLCYTFLPALVSGDDAASACKNAGYILAEPTTQALHTWMTTDLPTR